MGIILLFVFIPSLAAWFLAGYALLGSGPLSVEELIAGTALTILGLLGPLIRWKRAGKLHALEPPFFYLTVCVLIPAGLALLAFILPWHNVLLRVAHTLTLTVSLIFPIVCGYFFLAPEQWSVPRLLGIKPHF